MVTATSGAWKETRYFVPESPQSAPVDPAHLHGTLPEGRAPIKGPIQDVPLVTLDDTWADFDFDGERAGWERYGNEPAGSEITLDRKPVPPADTPARPPNGPPPHRWRHTIATRTWAAHNANNYSSGVPLETAVLEGGWNRSRDLGAVAGRARALAEQEHPNNVNAPNTSPLAGHNPSVGIARGSNGLTLNNPEGIPGHQTPTLQRFNQRKYPQPWRTHEQHALRDARAWQSGPQTTMPGDLYGSPFDSDQVDWNTGTTVPEVRTQPDMWDAVPRGMPLDIAPEPADFGGGF